MVDLHNRLKELEMERDRERSAIDDGQGMLQKLQEEIQHHVAAFNGFQARIQEIKYLIEKEKKPEERIK